MRNDEECDDTIRVSTSKLRKLFLEWHADACLSEVEVADHASRLLQRVCLETVTEDKAGA